MCTKNYQRINQCEAEVSLVVVMGRRYLQRYHRGGIVMKKLEEYVRSIPDFPEPGIIFRDITSILQDADGV